MAAVSLCAAAERQAAQTAASLGIACLVLAYVALVLLLRDGLVALAARTGVPLGSTAAVSLLQSVFMAVGEETMLTATRGRVRPRLPHRLGLTIAAGWAVALAVAAASGRHELGATAAMATNTALYSLAEPFARLFQPKLTLARRVRRSVRLAMLKTLINVCLFVQLAYVWATLSIAMPPGVDILVMGLAFPLVQWACLSLTALATGWAQSNLSRRAERHKRQHQQHQHQQHQHQQGSSTTTVLDAPAADAASSASAQHEDIVARAQAAQETVFMPAVLLVEIIFALAAFTMLFLLDMPHQTFMLSLMAMLGVELVQVVAYVRARSAIATVADATVATRVVGTDQEIREWLLYQEQGEKCGLLVSVGYLALATLWDAGADAAAAAFLRRLASRGAIAFAAELASDMGKDMAAQWLGVGSAGHRQVPLTPFTLFYVVLTGIVVAVLSLHVGIALAVSTTTALQPAVPP